jgi:hypothetical protein
MAVSKQETTCNAARQAGSARQISPLTPLQTGTEESGPYCTDRRDRRNNFRFALPDAIRREIGRPRASRRLSAAMVTLSRSRDIDRGFLPGRKRPLAYLSEITFDPTCGFAVPRRCALPGAVALDRSAGETVQRWPSSVTTVTDLRL